VTEADKAELRRAAECLDKALQAIENLSPDGSHELVEAIMADCESIVGDIQSLIFNLNGLAK
jgi:hypothetical protein